MMAERSFRKPSTAIRTIPDYQFNLAIALARRGDMSNALSAVAQALKLRPQDSEAINLQNMLRQPNPPAANVPAAKATTSSQQP